jgi:putative solute:sodium symporter small subunit
MLALSTLYRSEYWLRSRNFVLGLFGAWIALFFLTSMQPLNTLMVPGLDLPLGFYMPLQAAVIVFAVMVYRFTRATRSFG